MKKIELWGKQLFMLGSLLTLMGCGAAYYKESADKEVYRIIEQKGQVVGGMPSEFTIEEEEDSERAKDLVSSTTSESWVLSLREAIEIAVEKSRSYQSKKESLYSQGLSLTSSRHNFDPIFSGSSSGDVTLRDAQDTASAGLSLGLRKMLATGGDISLSLVNNLSRIISTGDPNHGAASAIGASISQPLLRGAGKKIALENLTQAERSMVYSIRDFVRYRKEFSVNIAQTYFNLLQLKDRLKNAKNNYDNLRDDRIRAELMAQAGRTPEFQVDQRRQSEFSARDSWIRAQQSYSNSLDQFKIDLGIPTEVNLEPNPAELEKLSANVRVLDTSVETAIQVALENRLDFQTEKDQLADAERQMEIAKDSLKPGLDMVLSYDRDTPGSQPVNFDDGDEVWSAGLDLDLPFDRTSERNSYRRSLISLASARRNLAEQEDRIRLEVRNSFRDLDQAEQSYQIQLNSLRLAERRVESTTLLQLAGRANTRDVLEAREDLLDAQNSVTQAIVDHFNTRLDLSLSMETLRVDENGFWIEDSLVGTEEGNDDEN